MHADAPYSIEWNMKDIQILLFGPERQHPAGTTHVGTLRPLYAYELQRRVLDDLGRVGLAVAPALNVTAKASIVLRGSAKLEYVDLGWGDLASCSIISPRGGTDTARLIFHRSFVERLIGRLQGIEAPTGDEPMTKWVKDVRKPTWQTQLIKKLCGEGVASGDTVGGLQISMKLEPVSIKHAPCCQIMVQHLLAEGTA